MLYCIKEICSIYSSKSDQVAKVRTHTHYTHRSIDKRIMIQVIIEDLRHLDTAIVMALSHARGDSTARGTASHWTKVVRSEGYNHKSLQQHLKHDTVIALLCQCTVS